VSLRRSYVRKYQAKKRLATPAWANDFFIEEIYHLAELRTKLLGIPHEVDHVIPLQSDVVCGLHVENNLQVITRDENIRKSNTTWPGMA
jgi:5-methylcytosine-specific restriction endonuclease McrA